MQFSTFPLLKDIRIAGLGWLAFLACASVYCILYNQMVLLTAASFVDSFFWSLREYAHWLLITPLLLMLLQRFCHGPMNNNWSLLTSLLVVLLLALSAKITIDFLINPAADLIADFVYFFPSQVCTLVIISILWKLFRLKHKVNNESTNDHQPSQPSDTVLVIKGNGEKIIQWDSVISITAAGNYLELTTENEQYLLRTTMKQLDTELPKNKFIRIHRSYMVNISKIEKIMSQPAGNGLVYLCNGQELPLSKSYKKQLKSFRLAVS